MRRLRAGELLALALLLPTLPATAAAEDGSIALLTGEVRDAASEPLAQGGTVSPPADVDATAGLVSLVFEQSGCRFLAEGVRARVTRADGRGVRLAVGDARIDLPKGQALHARRNAEKSPRVFLRAPDENTGAISVGACQTLVRVLPGGSASVVMDREGTSVVVQAEAGVVEVLDREAKMQRVLAGQRLVDVCVPGPGNLVEPAETRPPLTPYRP